MNSKTIKFNTTFANRTNTRQMTREIEALDVTEMKVKARGIALDEGLETFWEDVQIISFTRSDGKSLYSL